MAAPHCLLHILPVDPQIPDALQSCWRLKKVLFQYDSGLNRTGVMELDWIMLFPSRIVLESWSKQKRHDMPARESEAKRLEAISKTLLVSKAANFVQILKMKESKNHKNSELF